MMTRDTRHCETCGVLLVTGRDTVYGHVDRSEVFCSTQCQDGWDTGDDLMVAKAAEHQAAFKAAEAAQLLLDAIDGGNADLRADARIELENCLERFHHAQGVAHGVRARMERKS